MATGDYDSRGKRERELQGSQLYKNWSEGRLWRNEAELKDIEKQPAREEARARGAVAKEDTKYAPTRGAFETIGKGMQSVVPLGALRILNNQGKAPRKYMLKDIYDNRGRRKRQDYYES
jgi:hypothetical protein